MKYADRVFHMINLDWPKVTRLFLERPVNFKEKYRALIKA